MKISYASIIMLLSVTTLAMPNPEAYSHDRSARTFNILEARKGCSGHRNRADNCMGNSLGEMNSFHDCKQMAGKCCAKTRDGRFAVDVRKGLGREDCGFCFTGKCNA
ncbi:hypothetical protein BDV38DRAFT_269015 [Aspergillus pseudotamarii]|uniref:Uncharacterized protein n=1 Tax=Aspergillus pseudotamarii TaxID=132259 RepID=A0A5N6T297_ASPPS|nr:uncharacterized protein BDV38DRAFT_269015 [Aspergillus pseudotamarii]KAE8140411.1 hypothetical protein BDV38DRAFT_269015 [Aspergillus pseudotamarii]